MTQLETKLGDEHLNALDVLAGKVQKAIPDASYVMVGVQRYSQPFARHTDNPPLMWVIEFYLPARFQQYKVRTHEAIRILGTSQETFEATLEKAVQEARYYRTGKLEVDG
jgi:hypothetical protein